MVYAPNPTSSSLLAFLLACLLCLLACLLACFSTLELIFNVLLNNVTHAQTHARTDAWTHGRMDARTHTRHCLSLGSCRSQKDNILKSNSISYRVDWFLEQEDNSKLERTTIEEQLSSESWSFVTKINQFKSLVRVLEKFGAMQTRTPEQTNSS